MAASKGSGSRDHGANQTGGGGEPKQKRARSLGAGAGGGGAVSASAVAWKEKNGSSAPAAAPASASRGRPQSAAASLADVTVEDADALDCGVCFLPLKPPIYQCEVGHVVCSSCCDKLKASGKCHVCGVATGSYRRCHAMERLVESIRVPCPHATYGCTVRLVYRDRESHCLACPHAPCHCPGEACGFVGSTAALMDHFTTVHGWPCITNAKANCFGEFLDLRLHDGFNFLLADCPTGNKNQGTTVSVQCLLLLNVTRQPFGHIISVLNIDPHAAAASGEGSASKEMDCKLTYYYHGGNFSHFQQSNFRVVCTDLSHGMPNPDICFQFVVPDSVIGANDEDGIEVKLRILIK